MKKILMVMPHMVGGGAERVASLLVNYFYENSIETKFVLTADSSDEVVRCDLKEEVPLILLKEEMKSETLGEKLKYFPAKILSKVVCRVYETLKKDVPAYWAYLSILWQHHREIQALRNMMLESPDMTVIAFLQPAIPIVLLASRGLPNKIIVSERCDPKRLMKKRYGRRFIKKYYSRADEVVFQTLDAKEIYPENISEKGVVIPNPIKGSLPLPFEGKRNTTITTFCRISKQKNLPMLIKAFSMLQRNCSEYELKIIGDAPNEEGREVVAELEKMVAKLGLEQKVHFMPFSAEVHREILQDAMYVNSSDYEGISNAMLEAMAIGMPVVCTDCPIGGARTMIQNEENGLLTPVGDAEALYKAMKKVIENKVLADKISHNATELRKTLSLENIAKQWMELL